MRCFEHSTLIELPVQVAEDLVVDLQRGCAHFSSVVKAEGTTEQVVERVVYVACLPHFLQELLTERPQCGAALGSQFLGGTCHGEGFSLQRPKASAEPTTECGVASDARGQDLLTDAHALLGCLEPHLRSGHVL